MFPDIRAITAPGTLDGGDICEARVDEKEAHWFIGISQRTNKEGARQLARFLQEDGVSTSFIDERPELLTSRTPCRRNPSSNRSGMWTS